MTDTSNTAPNDPPAVLAFYKNYFASKTVIANAIGLVVAFGAAFGIRWLSLTPEQVTAATELIFGVATAAFPLMNWALRYVTAHPVSFSAPMRWVQPPRPILAAQVQPGARVFVGAETAQEIKEAAAPATDPPAAAPQHRKPRAPKPAAKGK